MVLGIDGRNDAENWNSDIYFTILLLKEIVSPFFLALMFLAVKI